MRTLWIICIVLASLVFRAPAICSETEEVQRKTNEFGMEFVLIPAGTFTMGSPEKEPYRDKDELLHEVTISRPFYMQTTEVTQSQWKKIIRNNPSGARSCGDNCPVERVSWQDCQKFITKLSKKGEGKYRLPTEAEWEYACRAGKSTSYSVGSKLGCDKAMYENNTQKKKDECVSYIRNRKFDVDAPAPVQSYPPNPWGLYDMHGNVWEWCQDWYGEYTPGPIVDPTGPEKGYMRVRRGGSFFKYGWYCRSANRNRGHPYSRYHTEGFRLIWEVE